MKKNMYTRAIFLAAIAGSTFFCPAVTSAQITINQAALSNWTPGLDSSRSVSGITVTPSNNGSWDLTNGTYGPITTFTRTAVSGNAAYPLATYSLPKTYSFSSLLGYQCVDMFGITATGISCYGQSLQRQPISLASLTMGANDSLVFNQQNIVYSNPNIIQAFPMTAGTNWPSVFKYDINFTLTIAAYALNSTPGFQRSYMTFTDSVVGWGKMRAKNASGQATDLIDVLAVKAKNQQVDSFFLGGSPAPAQVVTAFGLAQGQTATSYYIAYFRAGQPSPLLTVYYSDASYSTVTSANAHAGNLPAGVTGINDVLVAGKVNVYPNPVTNGEIHISIYNTSAEAYSYELFNTAGQLIANSPLNVNNGRATVKTDRQPGLYYINVMAEGRSVGYSKVIVR